jgi:hypothetical protein
MHAQPPPATPNLAPSCGVILRNLAALIARRFLHDPFHAALIIPLWQHLTRAARRLDRLLARLAAGPLPPPRPRASNRSGPRRKSIFPSKSAWLIRALGAEAAACAAQLEAMLADPAAADLLACTAARRALAPIRRMLGLPPMRSPRPITPASVVPACAATPRPNPIPHQPPRPPASCAPARRPAPGFVPPRPLAHHPKRLAPAGCIAAAPRTPCCFGDIRKRVKWANSSWDYASRSG